MSTSLRNDPQPHKFPTDDPKQVAYEKDRHEHRANNPMPSLDGKYQLAELRQMPYRERIKKASPEQIESVPTLTTKPKIYIASKASHRPRWRWLRDEQGFHIISTWIDTDDKFINAELTPEDYSKLWVNCVNDVRSCDVLVLYVEEGERLKGAIAELGIALGLNKEVVITGPVGDNGSWCYHPKVEHSNKSIDELLAWLYGQEG